WPEPPRRLACAPGWASSTPRWPSPPTTWIRPGFSPRMSSPPRAVLRMSAVMRWSSSAGATGCVISAPPARRSRARWSPRRQPASLPLGRLRARHELGPIDLLDHAGVERLSEARHVAEQMGALSTVAILDLQLAAAFTCRWELDTCDAHAQAAVGLAERLGLG